MQPAIVTPQTIEREIVQLSLKVFAGLPERRDDVSVSICLGALATAAGQVIQNLPAHERARFIALYGNLAQLALSKIR